MTCPIIYDFGKKTPHFFLSNFYPTPITVTFLYPGGPAVEETFPSSEHAFQAAKTNILSERKEFQRPELQAGMAKKMGQFVTIRKDWNTSKVGTMAALLAIKFKNPALREMLTATNPKMIVEGNYWHDTFWGVCVCSKHCGEGLNTLGRLLMNERKSIELAPTVNPVVTTVTV